MPQHGQAFRITRRLQEQSGSFFLTLPKFWVDSYDLEQGSELVLVVEGSGDVRIIHPASSLRARSPDEDSVTEDDKTIRRRGLARPAVAAIRYPPTRKDQGAC